MLVVLMVVLFEVYVRKRLVVEAVVEMLVEEVGGKGCGCRMITIRWLRSIAVSTQGYQSGYSQPISAASLTAWSIDGHLRRLGKAACVHLDVTELRVFPHGRFSGYGGGDERQVKRSLVHSHSTTTCSLH